MAIPDRPLVVSLDPDEMTVNDLCLFEPGGFTVTAFRAFLVAHTNWTDAEIGNLKVKELKDVAEQLKQKLNAAVPLGSKPS